MSSTPIAKKFFRSPQKHAAHQQPQKSSRKVSPFKEVPLLTRGPNSNLMHWEKGLKSYLFQRFGDFARFMDEDEHYSPPEIEIDQAKLGPEADPHGIYIAERKRWERNGARS